MDMPKRKANRLPGYDYSTTNAYFITICARERRNLFWCPVGATIGRPKEITFSQWGKIVEQAIHQVTIHYPSVTVDNYAIMPDHIHLLLQIHANKSGRPMAAPTISTLINQFKGYVAKQTDRNIWQKGFYDHIIRDENDYQNKWHYISGNPIVLAEEKLWDHMHFFEKDELPVVK